METLPDALLEDILSRISEYKPALCGTCEYWNKRVEYLKDRGRVKPVLTVEQLAERGENNMLEYVGKDNISIKRLRSCFVSAAGSGKIATMRLLRDWGADNFEAAFLSAAAGGHVDAMESLKDLVSNFDQALVKAAAGGYMEAIRRLLSWRSATDYSTAFIYAAGGGHLEAMKLLRKTAFTRSGIKKWSPENFDEWALTRAAEGGHIDAMKLLRKWKVDPIDTALARAAAGGQLEAMKFLKNWGARNYEFAFSSAATNSRTEAMKLLREWETPTSRYDYGSALAIAAYVGNSENIKLLVLWGARNYDEAILNARLGNQSDAETLLEHLKANRFHAVA